MLIWALQVEEGWPLECTKSQECVIQPHSEEATPPLVILSRLRAGGLGVRSGVERKDGIGDPGPGLKGQGRRGVQKYVASGITLCYILMPLLLPHGMCSHLTLLFQDCPCRGRGLGVEMESRAALGLQRQKARARTNRDAGAGGGFCSRVVGAVCDGGGSEIIHL